MLYLHPSSKGILVPFLNFKERNLSLKNWQFSNLIQKRNSSLFASCFLSSITCRGLVLGMSSFQKWRIVGLLKRQALSSSNMACAVLAWPAEGTAPGWRAIRSALGPEQRPASAPQTPGHLLYKVIVRQFRNFNWRTHLSCRCWSCVKFCPVTSMRTSDLMVCLVGLRSEFVCRFMFCLLFCFSYTLQ